MMRPIRRITSQIVERAARVNAALGDGRVICDACGATLDTYVDGCIAPIDVKCQGFIRIESARRGISVVVAS